MTGCHVPQKLRNAKEPHGNIIVQNDMQPQ